jgi:tripeptidyl-peptidase-1
MLKLITLAATALAVSAAATPAGWTRKARAAPSDALDMLLVVRRQNVDVLEKTLFEVSDPASPKYGKHLTKAQVDALTAPVSEQRGSTACAK